MVANMNHPLFLPSSSPPPPPLLISSFQRDPLARMAGWDGDYAMIVIDKIINPMTPADQLGNLVK